MLIMSMMFIGAMLEGAPALIIFGLLLTPIATQLGIDPLRLRNVTVIAMERGLLAPPIGIGRFAICAITGTAVRNVVKPTTKYLAVLFASLMRLVFVLVFVPAFSLWLPRQPGL